MDLCNNMYKSVTLYGKDIFTHIIIVTHSCITVKRVFFNKRLLKGFSLPQGEDWLFSPAGGNEGVHFSFLSLLLGDALFQRAEKRKTEPKRKERERDGAA